MSSHESVGDGCYSLGARGGELQEGDLAGADGGAFAGRRDGGHGDRGSGWFIIHHHL